MKTCSRCLITKPVSEFSGTYNYCRPCHNDYEKDRNPRRDTIDEKRALTALLAERGLKRCTMCRTDKAYDQFGRDRRHADGRQSACWQCQTERKRKSLEAYAPRKRYQSMKHRSKIKSHYNITEEEYEQLLAAQGGVCAICGKRPTTKRLCIDHRHSDGLVRGLICARDNVSLLGFFKDDATLLRAAADYLDNPPASKTLGGARYVPGSPHQ